MHGLPRGRLPGVRAVPLGEQRRRDGPESTTSCGEHLDVWVRRLSV
jgi:hypothetical protein